MTLIDITDTTTPQPPFVFEASSSPIIPDTIVSDELTLEIPTLLITGNFYNPDTKEIEEYVNEEIPHAGSRNGNTFTGQSPKTFIGPIIISFSSKYPLKTYPNIRRARNQIIGEPPFGYQSNKAEIRYNFGGTGGVHNRSTLYKRPITLHQNTAGSDNVLVNYRIFYKGKSSGTGTAYININKTDDKFYSFNENG